MKEYCFPAACSPKELRDRIEQRVREEQAKELVRKVNKEPWADLKLTWREELEFDFRFTGREDFHGEGRSWSFSETLRGRLESDGQGGSVLRGRFDPWNRTGGFFALVGLLCVLIPLWTDDPLTWLGVPLLAVHWVRHLKRLDKYPASQTILAFFEDVTKAEEEIE